MNWFFITIFSNFSIFLLELWLDNRQIHRLEKIVKQKVKLPKQLQGIVHQSNFQKISEWVISYIYYI